MWFFEIAFSFFTVVLFEIRIHVKAMKKGLIS